MSRGLATRSTIQAEGVTARVYTLVRAIVPAVCHQQPFLKIGDGIAVHMSSQKNHLAKAKGIVAEPRVVHPFCWQVGDADLEAFNVTTD